MSRMDCSSSCFLAFIWDLRAVISAFMSARTALWELCATASSKGVQPRELCRAGGNPAATSASSTSAWFLSTARCRACTPHIILNWPLPSHHAATTITSYTGLQCASGFGFVSIKPGGGFSESAPPVHFEFLCLALSQSSSLGSASYSGSLHACRNLQKPLLHRKACVPVSGTYQSGSDVQFNNTVGDPSNSVAYVR